MTVFKFNIYFKNDSFNDKQERFVVASNEEDAIKKIEEYRKSMISDGFDDFTYSDAYVEIENVIG